MSESSIYALASVNYKFLHTPVDELAKLMRGRVDGIELHAGFPGATETDMAKKLARSMHNNQMLFQIHADSNLDIDGQKRFLAEVSSYPRYLDENLKVTLHPIYDDDKELSIVKTIKFFNELLPFAKEHGITLCVENLNDLGDKKRLRLADIEKILEALPELKFTYDIGHAIWNGEEKIRESSVLFERLWNMHVHSIDSEDDHRPIYADGKHYDEILDHINMALKSANASKTIVLEYNLFVCKGETEREKIIDFLDTAKPLLLDLQS
jgi:sugar phosphate isomerase/epimerase